MIYNILMSVFYSAGLVDEESARIEPPLDKKPYTALVYGNGPGYKPDRENLTGVDTGKGPHKANVEFFIHIKPLSKRKSLENDLSCS